jgi:hypothetical protein
MDCSHPRAFSSSSARLRCNASKAAKRGFAAGDWTPLTLDAPQGAFELPQSFQRQGWKSSFDFSDRTHLYVDSTTRKNYEHFLAALTSPLNKGGGLSFFCPSQLPNRGSRGRLRVLLLFPLSASAVQFRKIPPLCVDVSGSHLCALISAKFRRSAGNSPAEARRR